MYLPEVAQRGREREVGRERQGEREKSETTVRPQVKAKERKSGLELKDIARGEREREREREREKGGHTECDKLADLPAFVVAKSFDLCST